MGNLSWESLKGEKEGEFFWSGDRLDRSNCPRWPLSRRSIQRPVLDCGPTISPFRRRRLRRLTTTSHFAVPHSTVPHSPKPPPRLRLPLCLIVPQSGGAADRRDEWGFHDVAFSSTAANPESGLLHRGGESLYVRVSTPSSVSPIPLLNRVHSPPTSKHFVVSSVVGRGRELHRGPAASVGRPFLRSLELVAVVVERREKTGSRRRNVNLIGQ